MNNEDYFRKALQEFDLEADVRLSAWAAQWFIEKGILSLEEALLEFQVTEKQLERYCGTTGESIGSNFFD